MKVNCNVVASGWLSVVLGAICLLTQACTKEKAETCSHDTIDSMLSRLESKLGHSGGYFPALQVDSLRVSDSSGGSVWFAIRWEGPVGGGIIHLSCERHLEAVKSVGAVLSLKDGPTLEGIGRTVLAELDPGGGAGHRVREFAIVGLQGDSIVVLWSRNVFERDFSIPSEGGFEDNRTVDIATSGDTLTITGSRKRFTQAQNGELVPVDSLVLPTESYCWSKGTRSYVQCP
jgi:hypothetical protein